jgi:pilus assembly protein CpaC
MAAMVVPLRAGSQDSVLQLGVGETRTLSVSNIKRVVIGDDSVAKVKVVGSGQVLVTGNGEGRTSLLLFRESGSRVSYTVVVRRISPNEVVNELRRLLGDREGLVIKVVGDRVFLDGQAYTTEDFERVQQVAEIYPNVKNLVKVAPNAKKLSANTLNSALQKAGLRQASASVVGTTVFLEGSVESQQDLQKAEMIAKAVGEKVENLLVVGIKRMVLIEVQFVEIRRGSDTSIGLKWPTQIQSAEGAQVGIVYSQTLMPNRGEPSVTANGSVAGQSNWSLGFRFDDGYGRLLSQPKLLCASGEKAEFLAGGEIPVVVSDGQRITVDYKPFGVILKVNPTADRQGNIQTVIESEVSDIDRSISVQFAGFNIPGLRKRQVKTNVTVRHGETIVLSGLFNHDQQKDVSKFPLLGHLPIVGELFKSRNFLERKSELVLFVTPRIVNPDTERIRGMIKDIKDRYKAAKDEVEWGLFD